MRKKDGTPIQIFCDGSGMDLNGKGSGFAWLREDTGEKRVERRNGLTNNQAEYCAVLSALEHMKSGSAVEIITDSAVIVAQLRGTYDVHDPGLGELHSKIQKVIRVRRLKPIFTWVQRGQNKAGRLLK